MGKRAGLPGPPPLLSRLRTWNSFVFGSSTAWATAEPYLWKALAAPLGSTERRVAGGRLMPCGEVNAVRIRQQARNQDDRDPVEEIPLKAGSLVRVYDLLF